MGSWIRCKCDHLVHKNLFAGTGMSLVATEAFLDIARPGASAEDLVSELVETAATLLECRHCGRLIVLRKHADGDDIRFYRPEST